MRTNLDQVPIVDSQSVLDRLDGDQDLYNELIEIYFGDLPKQMQILCDGFAAGDAKIVERQAHSLKSASANIGAERVRAVAFDIEQLALGPEKERIKVLMEQFQEEIVVLKQEFKRL